MRCFQAAIYTVSSAGVPAVRCRRQLTPPTALSRGQVSGAGVSECLAVHATSHFLHSLRPAHQQPQPHARSFRTSKSVRPLRRRMSVLPDTAFDSALPACFAGGASAGHASDAGLAKGAALLLAPQHPPAETGSTDLSVPLAGSDSASAASSALISPKNYQVRC